MVRSLCCYLTLLALLGTSWAAQQTEKPGGQKNAQSTPDQGPLRFDVKQLLQDHDLNNDGQLGRDEVPAFLRDRFDQLDLNKDGKLSLEELQKGAPYFQSRRRPSDVVVVLIEMSDCDDCCIEELQQLYTALRKADTNNDGKISKEELEAARRGLVEERVDNLLRELDRDKDGRLSREEARGHLRKDFDKLDTDKDGKLSREELIRAFGTRPAAKPEGK